MKVKEFLAHYGVEENPFGQEDAQSDHVFRDHCLDGTHHPAWDKIFGNPGTPSTSVVFGEKGSGKTALRLQIAKELGGYNEKNPEHKTFIIQYDDFNPFLDSFRERLHGRKRRPDRVLSYWRLYDHMDAILSLGVRRLVRTVLNAEPMKLNPNAELTTEDIARLSDLQRRDLLLLAAFYNNTFDQAPLRRWNELRNKLGYQSWTSTSTWLSKWDIALGAFVTFMTIVLRWAMAGFTALFTWWVGLIILVSWLPYLRRQAKLAWESYRASKQIRVFNLLPVPLRQILARFDWTHIEEQPMPTKDRSDDRYALLTKFQGILETLGYDGIVVLVDRVDEPHLINGNAERMKELIWPMFDNKFLKHQKIGLKLLLPADMMHYVTRAEKEFYERSRLDKQNLIRSLEWTGESLYDVANDRLQACAKPQNGKQVVLSDLFEDDVSQQELITMFARFRVPRHLFKFLYRLMVEHCNRHTSESPDWKIDRDTFQWTLSNFTRDLDELQKGVGAG